MKIRNPIVLSKKESVALNVFISSEKSTIIPGMTLLGMLFGGIASGITSLLSGVMSPAPDPMTVFFVFIGVGFISGLLSYLVLKITDPHN